VSRVEVSLLSFLSLGVCTEPASWTGAKRGTALSILGQVTDTNCLFLLAGCVVAARALSFPVAPPSCLVGQCPEESIAQIER
jgi:hypothetical protein